VTTKGKSGRIRLQPADSFDLIRLIARSQSDPRKAVAELVQNSLDAGANHVRVTWFTHQKRRALSVWDDGEGVFPDLDRAAALRKVATTIGHSHKARLSPAQRHEQMTLGKYGIGLLGFWSVAERMEIRSRVGGGDVWVLELEEEVREGVVRKRRPGKLPLDGTWTEVLLTRVHPAAENPIKPRRLAAYLAGELRGQLLDRSVTLEIIDRVGRGRAQKRRVVRPVRFAGAPVAEVTELEVPGHTPARVELYLVPESEDRRGRVSLSCGGATVMDDLAYLDGPDTPRAPWASGRLEGVIDYPDLSVAPSTRRGFVPDDAARAFLDALVDLEARVFSLLEQEAERRRREQEADDARDLRRLFRKLPRALPHYTLLDVEGRGATGRPGVEGEAVTDGDAEASGVEVEELEGDGEPGSPDTEYLYPPGDLATVEVRPKRSRIAPGGARRLRATPRDADGRAILDGVTLEWSLEGPGALSAEGDVAHYRAPDDPGEARASVRARAGARSAEAAGEIRITDAAEPEPGSDAGIPKPEPVEAPKEPWRSRLKAGVWEYNTGHPDYRQVRDERRRRLSYLAWLFAKEVVLRNFGEPGDGPLLERMVQVLVYVGEPRGR
jgi:hypothetical protein